MFFKEKKNGCLGLYGTVMRLVVWPYTGTVCILAYFIFSKMLNAFEIL